MNYFYSLLPCYDRYILYRLFIDGISCLHICFGLIHSCIGSAVDNIEDVIIPDKTGHLIPVGHIQRIAICEKELKRQVRTGCQVLQLIPQLAICTGYQYIFLYQSVKKLLFRGILVNPPQMFGHSCKYGHAFF